MMTRYLFLFHVGPVQAFIAQARRTNDLFAGSHILSELSRAGVKAAAKLPGFQPLFPVVMENGDARSGSHRFAFIAQTDPHDAARAVRAAIDDRWRLFADAVREKVQKAIGDGAWSAVFDQQKDGWMEVYWVAVPYDEMTHQDAYRRAGAALAQRKYARHLPAIADQPGAKCTLTGAQAALPLDWKRLGQALKGKENALILRPNERLGALALIKRLAQLPSSSSRKIHSTTNIALDDPDVDERAPGAGKEVTGYLAVLHMDGDRMGSHLSGLATAGKLSAFSGTLAGFAEDTVPRIIREYGGKTPVLVYAGGDDVLALLPLRHALTCADALRREFHARTGLTASAGIAITPDTLPLDLALDLARDAESEAKDTYGRDAIVIVEAHGGGQQRRAGGKWTILDLVGKMQACFSAGLLSGKIGYDLREIGRDVPAAAQDILVKRLFDQRTAEGKAGDDRVADLYDAIIAYVAEHPDDRARTWQDMANWLIFARFMTQGQAQEEARR